MAQDGKSDQEGEAAPPQRATEADVREAEGDAQSNARLLMPPQSVGASTAILRTRLCVGYTAAQISATLCLGRVRKDGGGKDNARPYRAAAAQEREPGVGGVRRFGEVLQRTTPGNSHGDWVRCRGRIVP